MFTFTMPPKKKPRKNKLDSLEKSIRHMTSQIEEIEKRIKREDTALSIISTSLAKRIERESLFLNALGLSDGANKGEKGFLNEISESILHLEEYLLKNSERVDNILVTLKNHREMLIKMNERFFRQGERNKIKTDLNVMKNTLSIMALAGIELDVSLLKDLKALQTSVEATNTDLEEIKKSKVRLDKKLDGELKRFDLDSLYLKKKDIPGYG